MAWDSPFAENQPVSDMDKQQANYLVDQIMSRQGNHIARENLAQWLANYKHRAGMPRLVSSTVDNGAMNRRDAPICGNSHIIDGIAVVECQLEAGHEGNHAGAGCGWTGKANP